MVQFVTATQSPTLASNVVSFPARKFGWPIAVAVTCSPPIIRSNGKSPAVVVHGVPDGPVMATVIVVSVVPMAAFSWEPSVSAWPYTRSSLMAVSYGVSGMQFHGHV